MRDQCVRLERLMGNYAIIANSYLFQYLLTTLKFICGTGIIVRTMCSFRTFKVAFNFAHLHGCSICWVLLKITRANNTTSKTGEFIICNWLAINSKFQIMVNISLYRKVVINGQPCTENMSLLWFNFKLIELVIYFESLHVKSFT